MGDFCGGTGFIGLPADEFGVDDVAFGVAVAGVAAGEGEEAAGGFFEGGFGGVGVGGDDFYLGGEDDFVFVDAVGEEAFFGLDVDVVAGLEFVDAVEHSAVGLAVACEREVAFFAGHLGVGVVSEAEGVEDVGADAFCEGAVVVFAEAGDVDDAVGLAVGGRCDYGWVLGVVVGDDGGCVVVLVVGGGCRCGDFEFLDEAVDGGFLGVIGGDVGPPELPDDEEE